MVGKPPAGWYLRGTHDDWQPRPLLEDSKTLGPDGLPLWERPIVVCAAEGCGSAVLPIEPGTNICLQHRSPGFQAFCRIYLAGVLEHEARRKREVAERLKRQDRLAAEAAEMAEREAGYRPPPDRFNFRGRSVRIVSGGAIEMGKDA